jgi:sulfopyruvate decarboxylase subunit beta
MIEQSDLMRIIQKYRGDAVVVTVERASMAWPEISTNEKRDVSPTVMGKGSSFALGLCLSRPDLKVILLDGDGSLLMNLGTLATVAESAPRNFYHFVLENGMYATTGGQPIPSRDKVSFTGLAKEAGYIVVHDLDDLEDVANQCQSILEEEGPVMVCVKTVPNPRLGRSKAEERIFARRTVGQATRELKEDLRRG